MTRILSILITLLTLSACTSIECKQRAEGYADLVEVELLTTTSGKDDPEENFIPALKYDYEFTVDKSVIHKTEFLEFKTQDELLQFINYKKGDSIEISYCVQRPTDSKVIRDS